MSRLKIISEGIWFQSYPLSIMGMEIGRNVTIIRLQSGDLIIHSTAPFEPEDVAAIKELGNPRWLIDVTNFHNTYTAEGVAAFPDIPYLATEGFNAPGDITPGRLTMQPEWEGELRIFPIEGMRKVNPVAIYHIPTKTLIVADLIFNLSPASSPWTRFGMKAISAVRPGPSMSRLYRSMIKDETAFATSVKTIVALDFEKLIVAHGAPILEEPRQILKSELRSHGYDV